MKINLKSITFESYSACNLRCVYCYNTWKRPNGEAPFRYSHRRAMKTLKEVYRQANIGQLSITGGEPLLNDFVADIILTAKLKGSKVSIISNGSGQADGRYEIYRDLMVDLFQFPIHSANPSIHDAMTQVAGSWQRSINSANACTELGIYVVPVIVLTRFNAPVISETLAMLAQMGLRRIMMNRYNIGGAGIGNGSFGLSKSELNSTFQKASEIALKYDLHITSNVCTPFCVVNPADFPLIGFGACSPDPFKRPLTVDAEGNLRTCNHSPIVAGNIFESKIESIVGTPYMKLWGDIRPAYCSRCSLFERCRGGCRAASEQLGMGLAAVDPLVLENMG